jgi:hypothetical protein
VNRQAGNLQVAASALCIHAPYIRSYIRREPHCPHSVQLQRHHSADAFMFKQHCWQLLCVRQLALERRRWGWQPERHTLLQLHS